MTRHWKASALALALLVGCGSNGSSISLEFPNESAREATKLLAVYAFSRDAVGVNAVDVLCSDLVGRLAEGESIPGDPITPPFEPPFDGRMIDAFPAGDPVIFVVGFSDASESRKPLLEGCSQDFDTSGSSEDVPINLSLVLPDQVVLTPVSGDRQAGHPGDDLVLPVSVRVTASLPGRRSEPYPIPGLPLTFAPSGPLTLSPSAEGAPRSVDTDVDGLARVSVRLPSTPGQYEIEASAASVPMADALTFSVSGIAEFDFASTEAVTLPASAGRVARLAIGDVSGMNARDVIVLGCDGSAESCALGIEAVDPPGNTRLTVLQDPLVSPGQTASVDTSALGLSPGGLVVDSMVPGDKLDVAFVNSRRATTSIGETSDGAEILVLRGDEAGLTLEGRYTLSASNAVGLTTYPAREGDTYVSLLTASQGRRVNDQPCRLEPSCLPSEVPNVDCAAQPELCGCAVNERCTCPPRTSCLDSGVPGVCVADDQIVDRLVNRHDRGNSRAPLANVGGCHMPVLNCDKPSNPQASTCRCADSDPDVASNNCSAKDPCACRVPLRTLIGVPGATRRPFDIVSGDLRNQGRRDIIVSTQGGLDFIAQTTSGNWEWKGQPIVNDRTDALLLLDADGDGVQDVAWYARSECRVFTRQDDPCPIVGSTADTAVGCLGLFLRDLTEQKIDDIKDDGCRRFPLTYRPSGMCRGDFNGDGGIDIAVASSTTRVVDLYLGDGRGGLLLSPDRVELPGERFGGPLACGRLDEDNRDDIVVASGSELVVLRTGP